MWTGAAGSIGSRASDGGQHVLLGAEDGDGVRQPLQVGDATLVGGGAHHRPRPGEEGGDDDDDRGRPADQSAREQPAETRALHGRHGIRNLTLLGLGSGA